MKPAKDKFAILKQFCNLIPIHLVSKLARKHGVHKKARSFLTMVPCGEHAS